MLQNIKVGSHTLDNTMSPRMADTDDTEDNIPLQVLTQIRMIRVTPETVVFDNVLIHTVYQERITLVNTLTAPVELSLKCSNPDRLDVQPRQVRIAAKESCVIELSLKAHKPFSAKSTKIKDLLFIKSDFFDQKVPIEIYPSKNTLTAKTSGSLQRAHSTGKTIEMAGESFGRKNTFILQNALKQTTIDSSFDRNSNDDVQILREQLNSYLSENQHLKMLLDQSQGLEQNISKQSADQLNHIKLLLRDREPNLELLLEESLRQEHTKQERKEQKVLEILKFKDQQIDQLQAKLNEAEEVRGSFEQDKSTEQRLRNESENYKQKARALEIQLVECKQRLQEFDQTDLMKTQALMLSQTAYIKDLEERLRGMPDISYHQEAVERLKRDVVAKDDQIRRLTQDYSSQSVKITKLESQSDFLGQQLEEYRQRDMEQKKKEVTKLKTESITQKDLQKLQDQVSQASIYLVQGIGEVEENLTIDKMAQDAVKIVQRIKSQYRMLEDQMQALFNKTKINRATQTPNDSLKEENVQLKEVLSIYTAELDQVHAILTKSDQGIHRLSTLGGHSNDKILISGEQHTSNSVNSANLLGTKLKDMKVREGQLIDQISQMKNQMKYQSSTSAADLTESGTDRNSFDHQQQRIQELENVVFKQREQLINTEENLIDARRQRSDADKEKDHAIEMLQLRNRNLQELNKKVEAHQSDGKAVYMSTKTNSTTAKTEQAKQQVDFQNLDLKHKLGECQAEKLALEKQLKTVKHSLDQCHLTLFKKEQDLVVALAGLNTQDSQLASLVSEQRHRIQQLESMQHDDLNSVGVISVREEYLQKLQQLTESQNIEQSALVNQLVAANQKIDNLKAQMRFSEAKEQRASAEKESLSEQHIRTQEQMQQKMRDIEAVLEAKNQLIAELEREVKGKEKTLAERQEQLSVLLSAMDNGNSQTSDSKQKLANLAAELCNVMASKSQIERRLSDSVHSERQIHLLNVKLSQESNAEKLRGQETSKQNRSCLQKIDVLERTQFDNEATINDLQNQLADQKLKHERTQYQFKLQSETVQSFKESLAKTEQNFKETIQQVRQSVKENAQDAAAITLRQDFKVILQKICLMLQQSDSESDSYIPELELALKQAVQLNEKLEQRVSCLKYELDQVNLDWDAYTMNIQIMQRFEMLMQTMQRRDSIACQKEIETNTRVKSQQVNNDKMQQELEMKAKALTVRCSNLDDQLHLVEQAKQKLEQECEILNQRVMAADQESRANQNTLERKAELTIDERFRAKDEAIRTYFDSQITKLMIGSSSNDRPLELGREICSLKLVIDKLQKQHTLDQAQQESTQLALSYYKEQVAESQQQSRDMDLKLKQTVQKYKQEIQNLGNQLDQQRQHNLASEREVIKGQELLQAKVREIQTIKQSQIGDKDEVIRIVDNKPNESQARKVKMLQEELIELRSQHLCEIEEIRLAQDVEFGDRERLLHRERDEIERRFSPGTAPGEILDQNHTLREKVSHYQQSENDLVQENEFLHQKCLELQQMADEQSQDAADCKRALTELESALLTPRFEANSDIKQSALKESKMSKSGPSSMKKSKQNEGVQFHVNPPVLVRCLVQAKLNEQFAKSQLRKHLLTEAMLRQNLSCKIPDSTLVAELINQNDAILSILNTQQPDPNLDDDYSDITEFDADCLVQAIVGLSYQLSMAETKKADDVPLVHEKMPLNKVLQAQRVIIKSLCSKGHHISYVPERENDRKIWYLELLESQTNDATIQTEKLQDFIKRLQVAVSGNLQSAAEIKATSMDLAQNTKDASEEIKTLRNVAALIKHDLQSSMGATMGKTFNPFNERTLIASKQTLTGSKQDPNNTTRQTNHDLDKLMNDHDTVQNQLSLTSKIKQSLEQELINLKLMHATELQSYIHSFQKAQNELQNAKKKNQSLEQQLQSNESNLQDQRQKFEDAQNSIADLQVMLEKAVQKADKTSGTTTSLRRLQQDMQEWRRQSDSNLRQKQDQLDAAHADLSKLKSEKDKIKSEVVMLRRINQDQRNGEDVQSLKKVIDQLGQQINDLESEKRKESEMFANDRKQLQDQIEMSQAQIKGNGLIAQDSGHVALYEKRISALTIEVKSKQSELIATKDSLAKAKIVMVQLESQQKEAFQKLDAKKQKIKELKVILQELEAENDQLNQAKMMHLKETDMGAAQIHQEMMQLRETFNKLKCERDQLTFQINEAAKKDAAKEWEQRRQVSDLQMQVQRLEGTYTSKSSEQHESVVVLQERNKALVNDLKYFRSENEKMQILVREQQESLLNRESTVQASQQEQSSLQSTLDQQRSEIISFKSQLLERDHNYRQLQVDYTSVLADQQASLKQLQLQYQTLRVESQSSQHCLASQLALLKQSKDKSKPTKDIDYALQVSQKEAALKAIKKELGVEKAKVIKLKDQKKELQNQLEQTPIKGKKTPQQALPVWKEDFLQLLQGKEGYKQMLVSVKELVQVEGQVIEMQANCQKLETQLQVKEQTVEEFALQIEELQNQLSETKAKDRDGKSLLIERQLQRERELKDQVRQLQGDISHIKQEYVQPETHQSLVEQVKELIQQQKLHQSEVLRKQKLITTLKMQKDSLQGELEIVFGDLKGLKDDNARLQKAIKDSKSGKEDLREMIDKYEWLQKQEKQMKEEVMALHDRCKGLKAEVNRKDSQIREIKEKVDTKYSVDADLKEVSTEIGKLKDVIKRNKLDLEIKENQIRALKQRLEQANDKPVNSGASIVSEQDVLLKQTKSKVKKYESYLRKSIQVLSKVGTSLVQAAPDDDAQLPSAMSDFKSQGADYYKDSVQILGVSMHELEDFINPTPSKEAHLAFRSINSQQSSQNTNFLRKLKRIESVPDSITEDIDEIGEYCCKLIGDLNK